MDRCDECGFVYDVGEASEAAAAILAKVPELIEAMSNEDVDVGTRRQPETWSPLEYACHLRDVLLVQRERVLLTRRTQRPHFEPMGRDERVDHDGYAEQDRTDVLRQLNDAAMLFANTLARLGPTDWERTLVYPYPEPVERSLGWVAVHTLHEVQHHLLDVRRQLPS